MLDYLLNFIYRLLGSDAATRLNVVGHFVLSHFIYGLLLIVAVGLGIMVVIRRTKNSHSFDDKIAKVTVGTIGIYIVVCAMILAVTAFTHGNYFDRILTKSPQEMGLSWSGQTFRISDRAAVAKFLNIIKDADEVKGHHSHAVSIILIAWPGIEATYSLGKDSQIADEYWFETETQSDTLGKTSQHFYSPGMTRWLDYYVGNKSIQPNQPLRKESILKH